jgi:hypothetical protein
MATIKISYDLSENGRRASLLAGGDGREHQTVEVPATPELLAIASIATDGTASYSLTLGLPGRGSIDYDAPIADPAAVALVHAAARVAAEAMEAEAESQRLAAKAARTAEWRALAARYLAGEELSVQTERSTTIRGVRADETDVTFAEWQAVDREFARRAAVAAECAAKEAASRAATLQTARLACLREHGAPADVIERQEAGVLDINELATIVRDALLPTQIGGVSAYIHHQISEVEHADDCEAQERGEVSCKWTVGVGDLEPLTSEQWESLKAVRTHYAKTAAVVDVRVHTAELSCNCYDPRWLVTRVQLALPEMALAVYRQYAL